MEGLVGWGMFCAQVFRGGGRIGVGGKIGSFGDWTGRYGDGNGNGNGWDGIIEKNRVFMYVKINEREMFAFCHLSRLYFILAASCHHDDNQSLTSSIYGAGYPSRLHNL